MRSCCDGARDFREALNWALNWKKKTVIARAQSGKNRYDNKASAIPHTLSKSVTTTHLIGEVHAGPRSVVVAKHLRQEGEEVAGLVAVVWGGRLVELGFWVEQKSREIKFTA